MTSASIDVNGPARIWKGGEEIATAHASGVLFCDDVLSQTLEGSEVLQGLCDPSSVDVHSLKPHLTNVPNVVVKIVGRDLAADIDDIGRVVEP